MSKPSRSAAGRGKPYTPRRGKFAGTTFPSKRQYRNALAREQGFTSLYQQQRAPRPIRSLADLEALSPVAREANRDAFRALDLMRDGLPLSTAARRSGTTPSAVLRHVGPAVERRGGRWVARPADRLLRVMKVLGEGGVEHEVVIRGSRAASLVSRHWSAVDLYLRTGDDRPLQRLRGERVGGSSLRPTRIV